MKKILLIEDNQDHAELIQSSLGEGLGKVDVQTVSQSDEAFKTLKNSNFDLILSDYYLPDSKGEGHIRKLSKLAPDTPIIIITGQGDEKIAAKSIQAGADDYIVKTREALKALPKILNRAFAKHQSHLEKKKTEIKFHLEEQKKAIRQILEEVENLEKKMHHFKNLSSPQDSESKKDSLTPTLEGLLDQVNSLKAFVKKMFSSGK